ncbi:MAG: glycoside hydrolase family 32 protein [Muribaculaceae bacterium]|nr:glycoside hydrolase family 32 protein [Muribaculaceae bacterium]
MKKLFPLLLFLLAVSWTKAGEPLYHEKYRPQYHFTPAHRWIGDPCGLIKHGGKYFGYSWGGAVTDDLLHWTELNDMAIVGLPDSIAAFTGSVVVDSLNTTGFGEGSMVAVFTSFDKVSKIQSQSIAYSTDGGITFRYYDGNPVLDIGSTEFRDPTVIWDKINKRWIMAVAKALDKKVAFYGSTDLRNWEWLSDFGPMGDSARSWECPDLFMLPVKGTDQWKWVLLVSINWAREQYFVGDFNGTEFVAEQTGSYPLYVDEGMDYYASRVFADYDSDSTDVYTLGWVNTWDYAPQAPSEWGKGVWSLPRKLTLDQVDGKYILCQEPVDALMELRGEPYRFSGKVKAGITPLPELSAMDNCYEMILKVSAEDDNQWWVNLCCDEGRKLTISYDPVSHFLKIDRTNCTDAQLPDCFARVAYARVHPVDGELTLSIYVDKSTVEIFTPGGEKTFTLLTYPGENQTGVELFSLDGATRFDIVAYPLESVHRN